MTPKRLLLTVVLAPLFVVASGCAAEDPADSAAEAATDSTTVAAPPTSTGPIGAANVPLDTGIDVPGSRAALEAGHAEIRRVLEQHLGPQDWREARPAQEVACPSRADAEGVLDQGIGKFYAAEMHHPGTFAPDEWAAVREAVVAALEPHGFQPEEAGADAPAAGAAPGSPDAGADYVYLINEFSDELTLSTHPTGGTGFGGFGACHPWGD